MVVMTLNPVILLFRRDLRIADNPALAAALRTGAPILPLFVLDEAAERAPGGAAKWWLHHSLERLGDRLRERGMELVLRRGEQNAAVQELVEEIAAGSVYWNRRYARREIEIDAALKNALSAKQVEAKSFNAALLREPWEVETKSGGEYRVFTPFWKAVRTAGPSREAVELPDGPPPPAPAVETDDLATWRLTPKSPDWAHEFADRWTPGEDGAECALAEFVEAGLEQYTAGRDRPDKPYTSQLSPHLSFGELSPNQIWNRTLLAVQNKEAPASAAEKFLSEIGWREFAYHLLYHHPEMLVSPLRSNFRDFPWRKNDAALRAWRKGLTGFPIVDAGMRQLWRTGWMHNRVRMIVASFLTKDLLIPWQTGEQWFWDTLVDADVAANPANWQWVAGCGADAAPYFRVFNPRTQGEKFDPDGAYVREFVPELAGLPSKHIHAPWEAPTEVLAAAGVRLGDTYPEPIVDHASARKRALAAYDTIKQAQ